MAIDWGLAPKADNYLSALQSFDLGRNRVTKDQEVRRAQEVRRGKTEYWNQTHPGFTPPIAGNTAAPAPPTGIAIEAGANAAPASPSTGYLSDLTASGGPSPAPVHPLIGAAPMPASRGAPGADALNRIAMADPDEAMKLEGAHLKMTREKLDTYQAVNAAGLQLMGGVHDQASYDRARAQAHAIHEEYGVGPDALALPDQYDPTVVQSLMMQAMKTSDQLSAIRAEKKLAWDVEDSQIDNARADRNTDSTIAHRRAQEGLTARGQDLSDARGRYGIGVASSDRRRGQDVSASTARRGQDLRETSPPKPRGNTPNPSADKPRVYKNPQGETIVWNGNTWVPAK